MTMATPSFLKNSVLKRFSVHVSKHKADDLKFFCLRYGLWKVGLNVGKKNYSLKFCLSYCGRGLSIVAIYKCHLFSCCFKFQYIFEDLETEYFARHTNLLPVTGKLSV